MRQEQRGGGRNSIDKKKHIFNLIRLRVRAEPGHSIKGKGLEGPVGRGRFQGYGSRRNRVIVCDALELGDICLAGSLLGIMGRGKRIALGIGEAGGGEWHERGRGPEKPIYFEREASKDAQSTDL